MKLSVGTWASNNKSPEEAFERIAQLGVEEVETIAHGPCYHVAVNFNDEEIGYARALLAAHKLEISAVSPGTEFLQFDEAGMEPQIEHMGKVVDRVSGWEPTMPASSPEGGSPRAGALTNV